ncbi:NADH:ubiquinone oxidoreductase [Histidinibacterium lentulum]|uniref:NADH:ubiquinone oxidoreductase n=2 Tax=Histidinibacterium lentulum TaxID=2480588 RepID=A0A3N2QTV2_9RHOB|nr:NADH:ubiquinone oxidoreductase [Histidinibacterium lentulum]
MTSSAPATTGGAAPASTAPASTASGPASSSPGSETAASATSGSDADAGVRASGTEAASPEPDASRSEQAAAAAPSAAAGVAGAGAASAMPVETGGETPPAPATADTPEAAPDEPTDADRPATLDAPREGGADDLKQIKGVGPKLEKLLNSMGFYHFDQVAAWTDRELAWVDSNLEGFKGRASRDDWVGQARTLADGGSTSFSEKVKGGDVY